MIPVDQTTFAPAGNCLSACIASILEIPIESIPTFATSLRSTQLHQVREWLDTLGYRLIFLPSGFNMNFPGYYIAGGPSKRGVSHAIVMHGPNVIHDPHPSRAGILHITHKMSILSK